LAKRQSRNQAPIVVFMQSLCSEQQQPLEDAIFEPHFQNEFSIRSKARA